MPIERWRCKDCDSITPTGEIDIVPDPKPGSDMVWKICPECRAAEQLEPLCDEPGCDKVASCGMPTENGYRRTCWTHMPRVTGHE